MNIITINFILLCVYMIHILVQEKLDLPLDRCKSNYEPDKMFTIITKTYLPVLPVMLFESQRRYWIHKEFDMHEESFEAHPLLSGEEDHVQYSL